MCHPDTGCYRKKQHQDKFWLFFWSWIKIQVYGGDEKEWHLEDPEEEYPLENGFLYNLEKIYFKKSICISLIKPKVIFYLLKMR